MKRTVINDFLKRHLFLLTLGFCLVPYIGILIYIRVVMHADIELATVPDRWFLVILSIVGIIVPSIGVFNIIKELVGERENFRLSSLLQAYAVLILIFASGHVLLQTGSLTPAFSGMPMIWEAGSPATVVAHISRLHEIYFDSIYLSVVTITTVGYGDILPLSPWAKILAAAEGMAGIAFIGVALGHYFSICGRCR